MDGVANMEPVLGIDLGTTFSAVACVNEASQGPELLTDPETQDRLTPSVVLFEDERVVVGRIAKNHAIDNPEWTVEYVKREMGKPKKEPPDGWQFRPRPDAPALGAEEISARILEKLLADARQRLGQQVNKAVITVPAYFTEPQRAATRQAAQIAGIEVLEILDEPVAAALAYGMDRLGRDQTVFVFDLGGGTFDVTVIEIKGRQFREIAIDGERELGGKEWDDRLITYVSDQFRSRHGSSPQEDLSDYQDLQGRVVLAKEELSRVARAVVSVHHGGAAMRVEITREKFEEITHDLVERCRRGCEAVLQHAHKTWADIDTVLLVGGATRMPMIRAMVERISGRQPSITDVNPDQAVAEGAAWLALIRQREQAPPEVVQAWGRAHPTLVGKTNGVAVTKVTARELGLIGKEEATGQRRSFLMIPKFAQLPIGHTETFGTEYDNQVEVQLPVTEGGLYPQGSSSCDPSGCDVIGQAVLEGIPALRRGSPIEVTFRFSADGVLELTARHVPSGRQVRAEIQRQGLLSEAEVKEAKERLTTLPVDRVGG